MGTRRKARELVLQALFQKEFVTDIPFNEFLEVFYKSHEIEGESIEYARHVLHGIEPYLAEIDALIQKTSVHWKLERMPLVDRNVMRLAVYEMLFAEPRIEGKIIINEAVELVRVYGSTDSSQFVNGVLDQILKNG